MIESLFEIVIIQPILNALVAFYKLFSILGIPGAFGFAIIAFTIAFRLLLNPLYKQQYESQKKISALKPRMDELQKKHKEDKTRLQQAQLDLYKEHGINPASGCLFAIVQIPLFIGLYQTLMRFVDATQNGSTMTKINSLLYLPSLAIQKLDPTFFFFNLADAPSKHKIIDISLTGLKFFGENLGYLPYMTIPVMTGLLQYLQAKVTVHPPPAPAKSDEKKEPSASDEFQAALNTQMKYFFPVMIGYFSYTLPVGLSLYWNIFSIFSILQARNSAPDKSKLKGDSKDVLAITR
jgi:YidC/Oxa1 family membrane protein insertase